MANEDYVTVAGDDWYQRRRQDDEGEFFRKVANQGPRKGEGGSTRQGIYCFTADGELLAYKNAGQNADVMRDVLKQGLAKWQRLPAERRKPGAVTVGDAGTEDKRFVRTPPEGGLVAVVYTRILDKDKDGAVCKGTCDTLGGDRAARDHLWLTAAEVKSLVPANAAVGARLALPAAIADRMIRFHLLDNTRGEPPAWRRDEIRKQDLALRVTAVSGTEVRLQLEGSVQIADGPDLATAKRGYDVQLFGTLHYQRAGARFSRFDIVAVGEHWGESAFTRNARPGRQLLGVSIELAPATELSKIPPQFAREWNAYFGRY